MVNENLVADAVVEAYPERAVTIWQALVEAQIAQTNPSAYKVAAGFLHKLQQVQTRQGRTEFLAALSDRATG